MRNVAVEVAVSFEDNVPVAQIAKRSGVKPSQHGWDHIWKSRVFPVEAAS